MENEQNKLVLIAENVLISEESKADPIFLTVDVKLCDSLLNANREGVTGKFIADVVHRSGDHVCLPFYADVKNLLAGNYDQLGHMFNRVTRKFGTRMIGSMSDFYTDVDANGVVSLMGTIKIPKRDRDIVERLVELYEMGGFAVSVELSYDPRELVVTDEGSFIDASENSSLTGLCLVWRPACTDAYAYNMVAEMNADDSEIVADGEEQGMRGETDSMKDEMEMTAEVTEETVVAEEQEQEETVAEEVVAEAEETAVAEDKAEEDPESPDDEKEKEDTVAEAQENANAEVIEHSVDTHEAIYDGGEGEPAVHVTEIRERFVETIEAQERTIAELKTQIAELEEIKVKYDAIIAEREAAELAEKKAKARAFAEKQGLDVAVAEVQEAIEALDYTKIAELTMAQVQDEEETHDEPVVPTITLASFVEMEVGENNAYGGLLKPRSK